MIFDKYDVIVFDVDGTLYFQNKLRLIMAGRLARYYITHLNRLKDIFIIKTFRAKRDTADNPESAFDATAKRHNVSIERVRETVDKWIYKNPLDAVFKTRDKVLLSIINELKDKGIKIVIWSDYYASDKLEALSLTPDHVYTAEDERVGELKPSPKALKLIMSDLNVSKEKVLMVGDRMEKDGEAARRCGVDYIILGKSYGKRKRTYEIY